MRVDADSILDTILALGDAMDDEELHAETLMAAARKLRTAASEDLADIKGCVQITHHERFWTLIQPGAIQALANGSLDPAVYLSLLRTLFRCRACFPGAVARLVTGLQFAAQNLSQLGNYEDEFVDQTDGQKGLTELYWAWASGAPFHWGRIPNEGHLDDFLQVMDLEGVEEIPAYLRDAWSSQEAGAFPHAPYRLGPEKTGPGSASNAAGPAYDFSTQSGREDFARAALRCKPEFYAYCLEALDPRRAVIDSICGALLFATGQGFDPEMARAYGTRWLRSDGGLNLAIVETDIMLCCAGAKVKIPNAETLLKRVTDLIPKFPLERGRSGA